MFGAPDLPRRQPMPRRVSRAPGVGDHVCVCGGYAGLIVDIDRDGRAVVASRTMGQITETPFPVTMLQVAPTVPLGFDQRVDRDWRRGTLG